MAAAHYLKTAKPLRLRYFGNPVLRKKCKALDVKTIRRKEVQTVFDQLVQCMKTERSSSLSASQVGKTYRFFAMEKTFASSFLDRTEFEKKQKPPQTDQDLRDLHTDELTFDLDEVRAKQKKFREEEEEEAEESEFDESDYPDPNDLEIPIEVIINPEWAPLGESVHSFYEMSMSCPGMCLKKTRPTFIRACWLDRLGNPKITYMQGFDARIFQHMCEHLDGSLYMENTKPKDLVWEEEVVRRDQLYQGKIEEILSALIHKTREEFECAFDPRYPPDSEDLYNMLCEFIKEKHGFETSPVADRELVQAGDEWEASAERQPLVDGQDAAESVHDEDTGQTKSRSKYGRNLKPKLEEGEIEI